MITKTIKKILIALLCICSFTLLACNKTSHTEIPTIEVAVHRSNKFDSAIFNMTPEEFSDLGFDLGDSVDITFPDGTEYLDVPYYNGYYAQVGNPIIVAYPGNDYITIAISFGNLWTPLNLQNDDIVTLKLNTKGKYLSLQETFNQTYDTTQTEDQTDEEFANFREVNGGNLKENYIYRGASPVDNRKGRATCANKLIEKYQIQTIIDLSDSEENMEKNFAQDGFDSEYAKNLYLNEQTIVLSMSVNYASTEFKESLASGLRFMMEHESPIYIHCTEGKDRTGFVCMVLEALCSSTYEEMCEDYMLTYQNYFGINQETSKEKYEAIKDLYFNSMLTYLTGIEDENELRNLDYRNHAMSYLIACGLTEDEIYHLIDVLTK